MKVSEFMNQCFPKHPYYNTLIKLVGDWEILENKTIRDGIDFEMIFLFLKKCVSEGSYQYMFSSASNLGVSINIPGNCETEKEKYDNAIKLFEIFMTLHGENTSVN